MYLDTHIHTYMHMCVFVTIISKENERIMRVGDLGGVQGNSGGNWREEREGKAM